MRAFQEKTCCRCGKRTKETLLPQLHDHSSYSTGLVNEVWVSGRSSTTVTISKDAEGHPTAGVCGCGGRAKELKVQQSPLLAFMKSCLTCAAAISIPEHAAETLGLL